MARRKREEDSIVVDVGRTGAKVEQIALNGGRTVQDALDAADLEPKDTEEIRVNGEEAELDDELEDGDRLLLVKHISGGQN